MQELTQEQAEAILQLQMAGDLLNGVMVMGRMYAPREDDDYLELGADELEGVVDGDYEALQLWKRG